MSYRQKRTGGGNACQTLLMRGRQWGSRSAASAVRRQAVIDARPLHRPAVRSARDGLANGGEGLALVLRNLGLLSAAPAQRWISEQFTNERISQLDSFIGPVVAPDRAA
jgi:hypothetical protein